MRLAQLLFSVGLLFSLTACKVQHLDAISGTYEGDYARTENGVTQNRRVSVIIEHVQKDRNAITIDINDKNTGENISVLHVRKDHTFWLRRSRNFFLKGSLLLSETELKLKIRGSCAFEETYEEGSPSLVSICISDNVIKFDSQNVAHSAKVSLYLNKTAEVQQAQLPQAIQQGTSLHDLYEKVQTTNYNTRESTQNLIKAQEDMKVARAGLIPAVGINGTLNLINYPFSAGMFFGNLVPFIFPTNWFQFNQKSRLADAEIMTYRQLIADQMSLAEDIYHEILRDQHLVELLKSEKDSILRRKQLMHTQAKAGFISKVDKDLMELDDLVTQNVVETNKLESTLNTEYAILTVGLGYSPRNGIQSLAEETPLDVSTLSPINSDDLFAEAKAGSVELTKSVLLEDAANAEVKGAQWSYLNPSDWIGWNASIEHKERIAKSNRDGVHDLRKQTESSIEQQVIKLTNDYNSFLTQVKNYQSAITEREKYVKLTQTMYRNGYASILQLRAGLEGLTKLKGDLETANSGLAEATGKIKRLAWREDYVQVKMMGVGGIPGKKQSPPPPAPGVAVSQTSSASAPGVVSTEIGTTINY